MKISSYLDNLVTVRGRQMSKNGVKPILLAKNGSLEESQKLSQKYTNDFHSYRC